MIKKIFLLSILFLAYMNLAKTVYIIPGWQGMRLFDITDPWQNGDDQRLSTYQLKQTLEQYGFQVKQADSLQNLDDFFCLITLDIPFDQLETLQQYPLHRKFLFLMEPPTIKPNDYNPFYHSLFYDRIYTWHDGLVDNKKYFKFYYPHMFDMIPDIVPFEYKMLCTMIACNKGSSHPDQLYSARYDAVSFFEQFHPDDFDLYGRWWPSSLKSYRGSVVRKVDVLKNYKFCICYENIKNIPGYITEKIFDCFRAGCVPIYWGAPNVTDYIPSNCFIARESFASNDELYQFLATMNKETYEEYIANIQQFLKGPQAHLYSVDHFVSIVVDLVFSLTENNEQ